MAHHRVTGFHQTHLGASSLPKEDLIEMRGVVNEVLPDSRFRVTLENGFEITAYSGGKMRKFNIRVLAGDDVTLEMSRRRPRPQAPEKIKRSPK